MEIPKAIKATANVQNSVEKATLLWQRVRVTVRVGGGWWLLAPMVRKKRVIVFMVNSFAFRSIVALTSGSAIVACFTYPNGIREFRVSVNEIRVRVSPWLISPSG